MSVRIDEFLTKLLAGFILLTVVLFFLAENGRINAFSTYLIALTLLPGLLFSSIRKYLADSNRLIWFATVSLVSYLAASSVWAGDSTSESPKLFGYGIFILAFIASTVICIQRYSRFNKFLLLAIIASATFSAVLSIYLHVLLPEYQPLPEPRLFGFGRLENPVIAAISYGFGFYVGVFLLLNSSDLQARLLLGICLTVLLVAIVLTGTRTVWAALALAIGLGFAIRYPEKATLLLLGTIAFTSIVGVLALGWENIARRALSFRPEIWSEFITRTLTTHPLIGFGSGTESQWTFSEITINHPHSIFVSTFYFGGLIGLALLLALYGSCVSVLRLQVKPSNYRLLATMALSYGFVIGFFDGDNVITKVDHLWWVIWLPISWCLVIKPKIINENSGGNH